MNKDARILITGHRGLVGHALREELLLQGFTDLIVWPRETVDLLNPTEVTWAFSVYRPEFVFHCAARVGGIQANIDDPLGFCRDNLAMQGNVFSNSAHYGIKKLIFLSSSCVYPKNCPQPMQEDMLLTGPFTPEVEAYGLAKIVGVKQCQWYQKLGHNFISVMPPNLFGPHDNFNEHTAHVIPGLMARMHRAKVAGDAKFPVWGDGSACREFMYSGDIAQVLLLVMEQYNSPEPVNVGSGHEIRIDALANAIANAVGYTGEIIFDETKPVGTPRKLMDNSKIAALGWGTSYLSRLDFRASLEQTYKSFLAGEGRR